MTLVVAIILILITLFVSFGAGSAVEKATSNKSRKEAQGALVLIGLSLLLSAVTGVLFYQAGAT